jgi:hypothetical protein
MLCSSVTNLPDSMVALYAAAYCRYRRVLNYLRWHPRPMSKAADYKGIKCGGQLARITYQGGLLMPGALCLTLLSVVITIR